NGVPIAFIAHKHDSLGLQAARPSSRRKEEIAAGAIDDIEDHRPRARHQYFIQERAELALSAWQTEDGLLLGQRSKLQRNLGNDAERPQRTDQELAKIVAGDIFHDAAA